MERADWKVSRSTRTCHPERRETSRTESRGLALVWGITDLPSSARIRIIEISLENTSHDSQFLFSADTRVRHRDNSDRPNTRAGFPREASPQHSPAHLRRTECRSLLLRRRQEAYFPIHARAREVRSHLCHEHRRLRSAHGLHRQGPYHVFVLLSRRQEDPLLLDAPRRRRLSPQT